METQNHRQMIPEQDLFELRSIFAVTRRWLWFIAACTILAGLAAFLVVRQMAPVYQASAMLLIEPSKDSMSGEYSALIAAERLALTYSELLKGRTILEQVIADLDLAYTPEQMSKKISVQPVRDTQLIRLAVEDESPEQAAEFANHLAQSFADQIHSTQSNRYAVKLSAIQEEMQALDSQVMTSQTQIDSLQAQVIVDANALAQIQTSLAETRSNIRLLEQDIEAVTLAMAQVMDNVKIIQPAPMPGKYPTLPYTASVLLMIDQDVSSGTGDYSSILASERLSLTYTQLMQSRNVIQAAIDQMGLTLSLPVVENKIRVGPIKDTQLIQLDVVDYDAARAVELANTIAEVFIQQNQASLSEPFMGRLEKAETNLAALAVQQDALLDQMEQVSAARVQAEIEIKRLESALAESRHTRQARQDEYERLQQLASDASEAVYITEPAKVPLEPDSNSLLYIGLSIIVGAMIGFGCAFLMEYLDDTLRTSDDVARQLGLGVLGKIGIVAHSDNHLVVMTNPLSPISEAFRVLANNIRFATLDQPVRSLLITSPSPREGKTAVLANLAVTMARLEQKVVAVDADLRMPRLHRLFGLEQPNGLTSALLDDSLDGRLQDVSVEGLKVLPCGDLPASPTEVIGSARMRSLLKDLQEQADLVLIDCPPVLPVADASVLASLADGVILVLRANRSRSRVARDAILSLQQAGAKVIGVVLNAVPARSEGYYSYAYRKQEKRKLEWRKWLPQKQLRLLAHWLNLKAHRR
jgi:polysaccharide biosynthesis transport protein